MIMHRKYRIIYHKKAFLALSTTSTTKYFFATLLFSSQLPRQQWQMTK